MIKNIFLFLIVAFLTGCGYKPTSYYAKDAITGLVYVELSLNVDNSKDSISIKDAVNELVLNQFKANLTKDRSKANTFIVAKLDTIKYSVISSDTLGFANRYRATVTLSFEYHKKGQDSKTFKVSNFDDYFVDNDSSIADTNKQNAITNAILNALEDVFTKIALNNIKK